MKIHYKNPRYPIQPKYPHTVACNGGNIYPDNYSSNPEEVTCLRCLHKIDMEKKEIMDAEANKELMENLTEFSKHIIGVGRMIGSTKITIGKLDIMRTCLADGVKTLDIYLDMLKDDPTLL